MYNKAFFVDKDQSSCASLVQIHALIPYKWNLQKAAKTYYKGLPL